MSLDRLKIDGLRNLKPLSIATDADCIIFTGKNGSGKTSILESIYLLSRCASFRTNNLSSLINKDLEELSCFGEIRQEEGLDTVGLVRNRCKKGTKLRLNGSSPNSLSDVAAVFPTLLITPYTFQLIEGGPKERRKLLDWGLFYVEPEYKENWRKWRKVLLQRNGLLKNGSICTRELAVWDDIFLEYSSKITKHRQNYFGLLLENIKDESQLGSILKNSEFLVDVLRNTNLEFYQGWTKKKILKDIIKDSLDTDLRLKSTKYGPQRADIVFTTYGYQAAEILSRGQIKILITRVLLGQLRIIREYGKRNCTVLVDDIGAELDQDNQISLMKSILEERAQLIVTVLDEHHARDLYESLRNKHSVRMFHVKHGQINRAV